MLVKVHSNSKYDWTLKKAVTAVHLEQMSMGTYYPKRNHQ
jgi:hypothetical protein